MFELKRLNPKALESMLEKAERYRLLNEPMEAESICRDVLEHDSGNTRATVLLILALTDQFSEGLAGRVDVATGLAKCLDDEHDREYYLGINCERRAKIHLDQVRPGSNEIAYNYYIEAMKHFDRSEELSTEENDDAVLRWNTVARVLMNHPELQAPDDAEEVSVDYE